MFHLSKQKYFSFLSTFVTFILPAAAQCRGTGALRAIYFVAYDEYNNNRMY